MKKTNALIASVFIAGLCSIIYELLISTSSSYFLGDSVKQFSITIGLYMAAMGIGSYLSRLITENVLGKFIMIEILLGFIGGISVPFLYLVYAYLDSYYPYMVTLILLIGTLIGLEIPLLTRLLERYYTLKVNISNVLSIDYVGALVATILFPFIILPFFGTFKSSLVFGLINMGIGYLILLGFRDELDVKQKKKYLILNTSVFILLLSTLLYSQVLLSSWNSALYEDRIIYHKQTKYQKLTFTKHKDDLRMYINGNLQFSAIDEYRYHESLIHLAASLSNNYKRILILGGGDGLGVREVLKHKGVEEIHLVDLDPELVNICKEYQWIRSINQDSLINKKVKIFNMDAYQYLINNTQLYDVIYCDLPDPNNLSLTRLYSSEFYQLVRKNLTRDGLFCSQSTSPFFAKEAFWCINNTIKLHFKNTKPYHVYVPSFGDWGFILARNGPIDKDKITVSVPTRFLNQGGVQNLFNFEKDLFSDIKDVNTMEHPILLQHYINAWEYWR